MIICQNTEKNKQKYNLICYRLSLLDETHGTLYMAIQFSVAHPVWRRKGTCFHLPHPGPEKLKSKKQMIGVLIWYFLVGSPVSGSNIVSGSTTGHADLNFYFD